MTLDTPVSGAKAVVDDERDAVTAKLRAYDAFVDQVRDIPTDDTGGEAPGPVGPTLATTTRRDGCAAVREAFDATVRETAGVDADASVFETLAAELSEEVAVALAPTTGSALAPQCKAQVIDSATDRRWQLRTMATALERESASIDAASEAFAAIRRWLVRTDETPLTTLDFDTLRDRHDHLGTHLDLCEAVARERQEFLDGSTSEHARVGLGHRSLVEYLYEELSVTYPVLSGVATVATTCRRCRRNVRTHLTRSG